MNSYPEIKTFFILGNLHAFTVTESVLPNLKLTTEHLKLFSVASESMSCDNLLSHTDLGGKRTKKIQIIQSSSKAWSGLHSSSSTKRCYTAVMISDLRTQLSKIRNAL